MITFETVTKTFPNDFTALSDVSFEIDPGELVFLLGPSGSGKTTLLRLILREIKPSGGKVLVAGQDISQLPKKEIPHLRRQIGSAFQDFKLLMDKTAYENIALVLDILKKTEDEIKTTAYQLLEKVGLSGKENMFPSQLSGGEIQRVAIARALALDPVLLFADEPTGNLDYKTSEQIVDLLHDINKSGTTVIISTHDRNLVTRFANVRQIHLEKGQLIKDTKKKKHKETKVEEKEDKPEPKEKSHEKPEEKENLEAKENK